MRQNRCRLFLLVSLVVAFLHVSGCHAVWGEKTTPPDQGPLDACLEREAPLSSDASGAKRCIETIEQFLSVDAENPAAEEAALQLGRFYMAQENFSAAYNLLLRFPEQYPKSGKRVLARMYLGICLYYMNEYPESLNTLYPLLETAEGADLAEEISLYIAQNYIKRRQLLPALSWYQKCLGFSKDEDSLRNTQQRVLKVLCEGWERETLIRAEGLYQAGFMHDAVLLGLVACTFKDGGMGAARNRLRDLADRHPDDVFTPFIQGFTGRMESEAPSQTAQICTIGCLLPLTGKYGSFGSGILDALILGARAFQSGGGGTARVRLLVRDTGGDPARAVKELKELSGRSEVVGIVGPLLATEAQACAPVAQAAGIPLICLSQKEDVVLVGDFIFQNGLTIRQQVDTLVEYARKDLDLSRFAILYPNDDYGSMTKDLYRAKVAEMGGKTVAAVPYGKKETDFQEEIRLLVGEKYWQEMKEREKKRKERDRLRRKSALDGSEDSASVLDEEKPLPPPFDALFIPDHYKKVSLIVPYLAFYDLNDVVLMGGSAWNSPNLVEEAGDYLKNAVFVDGFFVESGAPRVSGFVAAFEKDFGRQPRVLDALAYDSLLILEDSFYGATPKNRKGVRDALMQVKDYPGVSGATSFNENRCAKKRLFLLTVKEGRIQQVQ